MVLRPVALDSEVLLGAIGPVALENEVLLRAVEASSFGERGVAACC